MPELPEAETLVRGLRPVLTGRSIVQARVHHADVLRVPARRFRDRVRGRRIIAVERRAKNVLIRLDDGVLVVNLGMTGWLAPLGLRDADPPRPTHPAITFRLDRGRLVFDDVRRFGCVEALDSDRWNERDRALGPEPLEDAFTWEILAERLAASRSPLRSWLLDQRRVAGVGNIYACEACFRAGVHPRRSARSLSEAEARGLHAGIRDVLAGAVAAGGTTIRDYRNADGDPGEFARRLAVYGREGQPCPRCNAAVERIVFGNRSAFYCPRCQPAPDS
jgi:formamidopyrimidine-DNA glycosylase